MNDPPSIAAAGSATADPVLAVEGLTTDLLTPEGPRRVVDRLSLSVNAGEVMAIVGESGSGKSLAMLSILGLLPQPPAIVVAGSAMFEGEDLLQASPARVRALRGQRIGMVFQEPMSALNPVMPVGDQIAETLVANRGLGWGPARREAVRIIDRVKIADAAHRARLYPHELSGGMRQRIVIAAAIACTPSLIVADEPTTALDTTVQMEILGLLNELRDEVGCAIVLITHDMGVVRAIADRVTVMLKGRSIETGSSEQILRHPTDPYTRNLIAASSLPRTVVEATDPEAARARPPAMEILDLTVSFPVRGNLPSFASPERLFAVDGVSLSVQAGETLALVGESGSGKTTVARAVLGLGSIDSGSLCINGREVATQPRRHGASRSLPIQAVFQDPQASLDPRFTAWRSVTEPLVLSGIRDRAVLRDRATRLLADVGLGNEFLDRYPHQLSGGQRQRLGIARALSIEPRVLIADEAVSALDATTRLQVIDLLLDLQRRHGLSLLFITHDLAVVARIAHRVAVMRFGRILELGPTASVLEAPRHAYTRRLLAAIPALGMSIPPAEQDGVMRRHRVGPRGSSATRAPLSEVGRGHWVATD